MTNLTIDDGVFGLHVRRFEQVLKDGGEILEAGIRFHVLRLTLSYDTDDSRHPFSLILQL